MDVEQIVKTTQEQATAAWVNWLNQQRLDELLEKLTAQNINLEQALAELQKFKDFIGDPAHILGSATTKHGEIAENAQVYISNARKLIEGFSKEYSFEGVGRTAPEDYLHNGLPVQSKFYNALYHTLSSKKSPGTFDAIIGHLRKYPDFLKNGGTYEIPKDQYEKFTQLLEKPISQLSRSEYTLVKAIREWENEIGSKFTQAVNPTVADYSQVQQGVVNETISKEETSIRETDQQCRNAAYEASKPTLKQGAQASAVGAAVEGGMAFCLGIVGKRKQGKRLAEFTAEDWQEVGIDTAKGTVLGCIRGGAVYAMTNFTATPAAVANALVTATFGVVAQAYQLQQGNITAEDFLVNSEVLCLDASVSAVASLLGEMLIPVPILGAIIGNVAGMFMYQIAKDHLSAKEQTLISNYRESFAALNKMLEERYQKLIAQLKREFAKYASVLELAFSVDVNVAFAGSIELADYVGVPQSKILHSKSDMDTYFLN